LSQKGGSGHHGIFDTPRVAGADQGASQEEQLVFRAQWGSGGIELIKEDLGPKATPTQKLEDHGFIDPFLSNLSLGQINPEE
jgi:hypothetical protein